MADPTVGFTGFPYGIGAPGLPQIAITNQIALPQTATKVIFTVTGGIIKVLALVGYVGTVIGAVANATKITVTPTVGGAATDICATADLNAAAVGDLLVPITSFATALSINTAGVIVNGPSATAQSTGWIMTPGTILVNCAGSDGGLGRVKWHLHYIPMNVGLSQSGMVAITSPLS